MKNITLLTFFICALSFAQQKTNNIKGVVTYLNTPLMNAEIAISGSKEITKTDANGFYKVSASPGDYLSYSYPGTKTLDVIVEDVTRILNIELAPEVNQLDEVVVEKTVLKSQEQLRAEYATNKNLINTAFGILDKDVTSFSVRLIEGKDLNPIGIDLATVLQYRFAGIRVERSGVDITDATIYLRGGALGFFPAIYDVDGLIFTQFPNFLQVENIERLAIISGLGAVTKYGGAANGGVIVINTKGANYFSEPGTDKPYDMARIRNNKFNGKVLTSIDVKKDMPIYMNKLLESKTEAQAKEIYESQLRAYKGSYFYVLDAYKYFVNTWENIDYADRILKENKQIINSNPLALKALAYILQEEERFTKANSVYKEIFKLRPSYAQSYMDLANSYRDVNENKKAAAIYARYGYLLEEGFLRAEGDLGIIIERELNNLIALKGKDLLPKKELKKLILDDEFDGTRIVFEWNDSEAEFELQFVNPEGNYFKSEHSLLADANRIKEEKLSGFSSEEFLIDNSLPGTWSVNVNYLGNKSLTPTYLKATVYYNYSTKAQSKENVNQELFKIQSSAKIASN